MHAAVHIEGGPVKEASQWRWLWEPRAIEVRHGRLHTIRLDSVDFLVRLVHGRRGRLLADRLHEYLTREAESGLVVGLLASAFGHACPRAPTR